MRRLSSIFGDRGAQPPSFGQEITAITLHDIALPISTEIRPQAEGNHVELCWSAWEPDGGLFDALRDFDDAVVPLRIVIAGSVLEYAVQLCTYTVGYAHGDLFEMHTLNVQLCSDTLPPCPGTQIIL